ncbi:MAG: Citrate synthase 1 [Candidatus Heimdallarchaeota archaeon LC_2]|nr:MAG: Citrate synthase 1 [Candidatus Heimdallarchaeota archaeon LC_2]
MSDTNNKAKIHVNGNDYEFPLVKGSEGELGINFVKLRAQTGIVSYDPGYANTGSCSSGITFINGEEGILRYRGYNIDSLANNASFLEICYLIVYGDLPNKEELDDFTNKITRRTLLHEEMRHFFDGFHSSAHPMIVLSTMVSSLGGYYPTTDFENDVHSNIIRLIAKLPTIAAFSYKKSIGQPFMYPRNDLDYVSNFLYMMNAVPTEDYKVNPVVVTAMNKLLILHADHEQNCSASTVRMVGSSQANLFSAVSAGISALSGQLHGGANSAVIRMLQQIHDDGGDYDKAMTLAKDKTSGFKLMGFGHRVYKSRDPRAEILKQSADDVLSALNVEDPLLEIAKNLEKIALEDEYFKSRNLYPNVDFYSGIIYRALGIPTNMFTVIFAMGRLPGWIAHFIESRRDPEFRIHRPRQIYIGETERKFVPVDQR